ncbi:MAG: hypothetical protein G01um101493_163 [Microgenomates group bacterium Gr01-1014_93]|nr:MAG: hypothetical protein G01um101493_163 [Microgenomates group bacterium Gr01-1014_93]
MIDAKLARILSNFCLDIAKAYFIATFIAPSLGDISAQDVNFLLIRGTGNVILFLLLAWGWSKQAEN